MPTNKLTDAAIRAARATGKSIKLSDGGGLFLLVVPTGGRLWRLAYRYAGKQHTLALGPYPGVTLGAARMLRDEAKASLRAGRDPREAKKLEKANRVAPEEPTFASVAKSWFSARQAAWAAPYADRVWSRVKSDLIAQFGQIPISVVSEEMVLSALRLVEARGAIDTAKRLRQYAEDIFRFAKASRLVNRNPAIDLGDALASPPPVKRRTSIKIGDLPKFLHALDNYHGEKDTLLALRFTLLTFVRTSEVRFARWSEFENLDGPLPIWRIPAERMKARAEHLVPLSSQAVETIRLIRKTSGESDLLFPCRARFGVISENRMIYALYRMGWHGRATVHGFRGTASTVLNENGFNRDWIERQLAHAERDRVRAAYNSAEWLVERRRMMQWWADKLDELRKVSVSVAVD